MTSHSITYPTKTPCTRHRVEHLQGGDEAEVWDGSISEYVWMVVMDAVQRDGRTKVRVRGATYYFAADLARDIRVNHYLPPASAQKTVEIMRVDDEYFRIDKYY